MRAGTVAAAPVDPKGPGHMYRDDAPASPHDPDGNDTAVIGNEQVHRVLAGAAGTSRFFAGFAILGTALAAAAIYLYAIVFVLRAIWEAFAHASPGTEDGMKQLTLQLVEATDAFLLATVLYIVSIGFFQLFVDADVSLPTWLRITNLDELKSKLIGVVVVLLGVTFLGKVADWQGDRNIAFLGGAIALVIASLGYFGFRAHEKDH